MDANVMRNVELDAHNALTDAIDDGGRLRMTIPADPSRDTDLRISAALSLLRDAARQQEQMEARIAEVLFNVSNFPRAAQAYLWGQDMEPLRKKLMEAINGRS